MDWAKTTTRRDEKHLSVGIWYLLYYKLDGTHLQHSIYSTNTRGTGCWGFIVEVQQSNSDGLSGTSFNEPRTISTTTARLLRHHTTEVTVWCRQLDDVTSRAEWSISYLNCKIGQCLIHWSLVAHTCLSKPVIIGSGNDLSSVRNIAIIFFILKIGPVGIYFREIWTEIT